MASIHVFRYVIATVNGRTYKFGSLAEPIATITAGSNLAHEVIRSVAQNITATLYDATTDIADFDYMLCASDQDVLLELTTDQNNGVGDEPYTVPLSGSGTANEYGLPFDLGRDDSYANYTVNFGGGTLDVIDRVRVRNLGSTTANVVCLAFT